MQTALAGAAVLVVLLTSTGCSEAIHNSGEDNRFIRQPGMKLAATGGMKLKSGPLLPQKPGSSWRNRVMIRSVNNPVSQNYGQETVEAKGFSPLAGGGGNGLRLETTPEKQSKPSRIEVFKVDKKGISLSRIEGEQTLATIPPLPIISNPVREGDIKKWTGVLRLANNTYPCQGYSRVRSPEEITLPHGKVAAYRVDSILITRINGSQAYVPMTRWFAPGLGIVRYRFTSGNSEVTKEMVSYKL
jgi:hypothetical protein